MPVRLLIPFINFKGSGGLRIGIAYANGLADLGVDVSIISPDTKINSAYGISEKIRIINISPSTKILSRFGYMSIIFLMAKRFPRPDFVLAPSWQSVIPAKLAGCEDAQIIHLVQHDDEIIDSGRCSLISLRNRLIFRWVYGLATHKVTVSGWLRDHMKAKYGFESSVISNGVDIANFSGPSPLVWSPETSEFTVMCIGRAADWKGFDDILRALRITLQEDIPIRLLVVTQEDLSYPWDLPITVVRPKNDKELGAAYRGASVFVCASWAEGFGLPPLEAMANGVPVITTMCGGVNDYAVDGQNCLMVPTRDPVELAKALLKLYQDKNLASRIATRGLLDSKSHTVKNSVSQMYRLLTLMHFRKIHMKPQRST
jgi:glycosyltransferase involved in cell wall biosynthesis